VELDASTRKLNELVMCKLGRVAGEGFDGVGGDDSAEGGERGQREY